MEAVSFVVCKDTSFTEKSYLCGTKKRQIHHE